MKSLHVSVSLIGIPCVYSSEARRISARIDSIRSSASERSWSLLAWMWPATADSSLSASTRIWLIRASRSSALATSASISRLVLSSPESVYPATPAKRATTNKKLARNPPMEMREFNYRHPVAQRSCDCGFFASHKPRNLRNNSPPLFRGCGSPPHRGGLCHSEPVLARGLLHWRRTAAFERAVLTEWSVYEAYSCDVLAGVLAECFCGRREGSGRRKGCCRGEERQVQEARKEGGEEGRRGREEGGRREETLSIRIYFNSLLPNRPPRISSGGV